ncbi:MAG: BatA domain-containing protein, partial [Gemmataceae bacterium]|nr:BatA domain-containing protein [Gemmataceae bacterium]
MSFLSPLMLWGSLAAGIPIALHFFFRSRYRTVPWAAMKFLLESIEQTSRRLRFQELLLLVVRCLLLIVLALAFARPISSASRGSGRGDAVDAVFLFDVSYSMTARDGAGTRFDRAQAAALKVLEELPPHSTVQIVTCADRAAVLGPQTPGNLDQAAAIIKNLRLTSLATDLAPGVVEAASILQRGQAANKELYLFSDLQRSGWQRQSGLLVQTFNEIKEKAAVTLVRCGAGPVKNLSVVGIVPQERAAAPEQRLGFAVLVRNTGTIPVDDAVVSLTVDGDDKTTETTALSSVAPGETRVAALTAKLGKAGLAVLTARLRGDELDGDNRFDQVLKVHDHIDILVVDGGMENRASLVDALHSDLARQRVQPSVVTPRLAAPALLDKKDIVILANVALAADPRRLAEVPPAD